MTYDSLFSGLQPSSRPVAPSLADQIAQFKASVQDLVRSAEALGSLVAPTSIKINFDELFERLSDKTDIILEELKAEFSEPLPEDRSEGYTKREKAVDQALDKLEGAVVEVYGHWNVPEAEARERFSHIKLPMRRVVLLVGE